MSIAENFSVGLSNKEDGYLCHMATVFLFSLGIPVLFPMMAALLSSLSVYQCIYVLIVVRVATLMAVMSSQDGFPMPGD